jgi:hypothetical protein
MFTGSTGDEKADAWIIAKCNAVNKRAPYIYVVFLSILVLGTLLGVW